MATGYCVKCKKPHEMSKPHLEKVKNRYLLKGTCEKTSVKMTKFVGKDEASKYESFAVGDTKRQLKYDAVKVEKATPKAIPEPPVYSPPPSAPSWQPEPAVVAEAPKVEEKPEPEPETVEEPEPKPMTPAEADVMEASDWEEPEAEEPEEEPEETEDTKAEEVEEFAAPKKPKPKEYTYEISCPGCGTIFEVESKDTGYPPFDVECPDCGELVGSEHMASPQPFPASPDPSVPQPRYPFPKLDRDMLLTVGGLAALFSIPFIIKAIGKKEQPKQ